MNADKPPTNHAEYLARYHRHARMTGHGIVGTRMHVPCQFCAAPDWLVFSVMTTEDAFARGATCDECGRTAKTIITKSEDGYVTASQIVQTGGRDAPAWLLPKIQRVQDI